MTITYTATEEIIVSIYRPCIARDAKPGEMMSEHIGQAHSFLFWHPSSDRMRLEVCHTVPQPHLCEVDGAFDGAMCRFSAWRDAA